MTIDEYFGKWMRVIDRKELKYISNKLMNIPNPRTICPRLCDVFRVFFLCPYDDCKTVILAQDPYPQMNVATGIAFGNRAETLEENISPSLQVLRDSAIDPNIPHGPIEFDITLESWVKQGVLLLNSALTCELNKIGSHVDMWRRFISSFLENNSTKNPGVIYVLLGKQAESFECYINIKDNVLLKEHHPSYYARVKRSMPSAIFNQINSFLKERYNSNIEWYKNI